MRNTLRLLCLGAASALVLIAVALYPVLGTDPDSGGEGATSALVPILGVVVLGVVVHLLVEAVGYRVRPLEASLSDQQRRARTEGALMTTGTLRLALCDAVAILALAAAFVLPSGGFALYAVGAIIAAALLGLHVYPWSRPLAKVQAALERDGVVAPVAEVLGRPAGPAGPISSR